MGEVEESEEWESVSFSTRVAWRVHVRSLVCGEHSLCTGVRGCGEGRAVVAAGATEGAKWHCVTVLFTVRNYNFYIVVRTCVAVAVAVIACIGVRCDR